MSLQIFVLERVQFTAEFTLSLQYQFYPCGRVAVKSNITYMYAAQESGAGRRKRREKREQQKEEKLRRREVLLSGLRSSLLSFSVMAGQCCRARGRRWFGFAISLENPPRNFSFFLIHVVVDRLSCISSNNSSNKSRALSASEQKRVRRPARRRAATLWECNTTAANEPRHRDQVREGQRPRFRLRLPRHVKYYREEIITGKKQGTHFHRSVKPHTFAFSIRLLFAGLLHPHFLLKSYLFVEYTCSTHTRVM